MTFLSSWDEKAGRYPGPELSTRPAPAAPQHIHSRSTLECAYRTHLVAGIGFYQHLLLYIQSHYQLELQCCIDWTHVTDPLIGQWLGSEPPCRPLGPRGPRGSWSL